MANMNVALILSLVDQLSGPLSKVKKGVQGFRDNLSKGWKDGGGARLFDPVRLEENLRLNERRIQETRGRLMGAFGTALTLAAPVKLAADFDQSFKGVEKVVDAPKKRLAELRDFALRTSMQVPVAARDLLELMAEAAQGGVPTEDLERFTAFTSRMAVAADMAGGEIGERFAKIRNVYKLNQEGIEALGDSANHLSNKMAAKAREIFDFTNRASGGAAMLKQNAVQMNAIGAALVASGIVPETAARGFNVFANKLVAGGKKVDSAFKSVGLSRKAVLDDFRERGPEAFADFIERLADKGDVGAAALAEIVGVDFSDDFGKLLANPEVLRQALALIADPAAFKGSALEEAAKQSEGAAQKFAQLKNQITAAAIYFGTVLLPPLLKVTSAMGELVIGMTDWATANPELFSMIVQTAAVLLGLSVATKVAAFGFAVLGGGLLRTVFLLGKAGRGIGWVARMLGLAATKPAVFARALRAIPALRWATLIPRLAWGAFIFPIKWLRFVPKIGWAAAAGGLSWRALIPILRWGARFIPVIGWVALATELAWHMLIKPLGWDKFLNLETFSRIIDTMKAKLDGLVDRFRNFLGLGDQVREGDEGYVDLPDGAAGRKRGRERGAVQGKQPEETVPEPVARDRRGRLKTPPPQPNPQRDAAQSGRLPYDPPAPARREAPTYPIPAQRPPDIQADQAQIEQAGAASGRALGDEAVKRVEGGAVAAGQAMGGQAATALNAQAAAIGSTIGQAVAAQIKATTVTVNAKVIGGAAGRKNRRATRGAALADGVDDE